MADSTISGLTNSLATPERTVDVLAIDDVSANETKKITLAQLATGLTSADLPTHTHTYAQITDPPATNNTKYYQEYFEDFIGGANSNWNGFIAGNSGGGTNANGTTSPDTTAFGIVRPNTGSTATGRSGVITNTGGLWLGLAKYTLAWRLRLLNLSTDTQEFNVRVGMMNTTNNPAEDGIYFMYDRLVSVNWLLVKRINNVDTVTDTGVAVQNFTTWVRFDMTVNTDLTATMSIDDVAYTVPSGTLDDTNSYGICCLISKTVGTTGATMDVDYCYARIEISGVTR